MRQANSSIRGYLYQFNKTILEILNSSDDKVITLEGIEDIEINSSLETILIQCKYHEALNFSMSNVALPILEMFAHYCNNNSNKNFSYRLYIFFKNEAEMSLADFESYIKQTKSKEIILKFFHQIFIIQNINILNLINKNSKNESEEKKILSYYEKNINKLEYKIDINIFWEKFEYIKAEEFDSLEDSIIEKLQEFTDKENAKFLFYPNAFSKIAELSSKPKIEERKITKQQLISFLVEQKTILLNNWSLQCFEKKQILKHKKDCLSASFKNNTDIRVFIFSKNFLEKNGNKILFFIKKYVSIYNKKTKLQKPPIFIFAENYESLMNDIIQRLYKLNYKVNEGLIGGKFFIEEFITNYNNCSCKITTLENISIELLQKCDTTYLYVIGDNESKFEDSTYYTEKLNIFDINILYYLTNITKTLEEFI